MNNNSDISKNSQDSTLNAEKKIKKNEIIKKSKVDENPYAMFRSEDSEKIIKKPEQNIAMKKSNIKKNFKNLFKKIIFKYRKNASFKVDSIKILYYCLGMLSAEYFIYLIFQIISLIFLQNFFSSWIVGLILFIVYIPLLSVGIFLVNNKYFFMCKIVKIFEFLVFFFFLGWCAGYFGFEGLSLSYVILINFLFIFLFIYLSKKISIIVLIIMLILLLLDIIIVYAFGDNWWEPAIIMIFLIGQILVLNYDMKSLFEITKMSNPDSFLTFSLCFTLKLCYIIMFENERNREIKKLIKEDNKADIEKKEINENEEF